MAKVALTVKIFYAYARTDKDEPLRNELEKHLSNLQRQSHIVSWSDQNISAGDEWKQKINAQLEKADIVLLLVSPDFMYSDYCYSFELKRALEKRNPGMREVIPIILRPVDWENSLFSDLQALPTNAKPITKWDNQDEAFLDVAKGIRKVVPYLVKWFSRHLSCSTFAPLVRKEKQNEHMSSTGAFHCIPFPFPYPALW